MGTKERFLLQERGEWMLIGKQFEIYNGFLRILRIMIERSENNTN